MIKFSMLWLVFGAVWIWQVNIVLFSQEAKLDNALLNRVKQEAPKAWENQIRLNEKYARSRKGYECVNVAKGERWANKIFPIDAEIVRRVFDSHHKQVIYNSGNHIVCFNPNYFFILSRSSQTTGWVLKETVRISEESLAQYLERHRDFQTLKNYSCGDNDEKYLRLPYDFGAPKENTSVFDLEQINFLKCYDLEYQGAASVAVEFQIGRDIVTKENTVGYDPSACFLIMNPENSWAITYMKCEFNKHELDGPLIDPSFSWSFEVEQEFDQGFAGGARLKKTVLKERISAVGDRVVELTNNCSYSQKNLKPGDFYLSAFGLPEPDWYTPPKPWWFYTSIVGMVLVVVGAIVFHFGKRLWREGSAKKSDKKRR